ncbi:conjugal transfer protein TraM [Salmonella enterica]|jgi:hypothetical protein|nr:conjugal transfer protein TraM [Salmonella enterica]
MIDIEHIRAEIARKHKVIIADNDPVLATVLINEMVLQRYLDLASEGYEEANRQLSIAIAQQTDEAKGTAAKLINDSADFAASKIRDAAEIAMRELGVGLREQLAAALDAAKSAQTINQEVKTAKRGIWFAVCLAAVAAAASIGSMIYVLTNAA